MKMKYLLSSVFSLALGATLMAQMPEYAGPNIVPNPSFENKKPDVSLPKEDADGSAAFRLTIADWTSPTMSTPDWLIMPTGAVNQAKKSGQPTNEARTGIKAAAILTHNPTSERSNTYREYIQVRLTEPTKPNKEYYFEFWVRRDYRAQFASNNIGIVFSPGPLTRMDGPASKWDPILDVVPDYNEKSIINPGAPEWVRISGIYKSSMSCQFIIIGNFFDNNALVVEKVNPKGDFANPYYLIDDVAVHEVLPEPEKIVEVEIPKPEPKKFSLDHVYFETAKYNLLPSSNAELDRLVAFLQENMDIHIEIGGHTDSRGTDEANQKLSENRVRSVYNYLVGKGIEANRLTYVGYGEMQPRDTNDTEEGRKNNRRVEVKITQGGENVDFTVENREQSYQGGD